MTTSISSKSSQTGLLVWLQFQVWTSQGDNKGTTYTVKREQWSNGRERYPGKFSFSSDISKEDTAECFKRLKKFHPALTLPFVPGLHKKLFIWSKSVILCTIHSSISSTGWEMLRFTEVLSSMFSFTSCSVISLSWIGAVPKSQLLTLHQSAATLTVSIYSTLYGQNKIVPVP